ncbi:hypothetical protein JYT16_00780 [Gemmatimonas aurantiaca]|nr:hypothetical protein [Gemmatimonas aurantiaca]
MSVTVTTKKKPKQRFVETISLRKAGFPITPAISAAFYQAEEEALGVSLLYDSRRARFHSALDSESVSLQCDKSGRLIFLQVRKPRRLWIGEHGISAIPSPALDLRFLDFRCRIPEPQLFCDAKKESLLIKFGDVHSADSFQLGDNVYAYIGADMCLRGLYVDLINEDRAGKKLAVWRKLIAGTEVTFDD